MRLAHLAKFGMLAVFVLVSACSTWGEREPRPLNDLRNRSGEPEEFSIVPNKPLVTPPSFSELPDPTPGQGNLTDQTPKADLVAALGGNPARLQPGSGVGAGDQALVKQASRNGTDPEIREKLASEDQEFRVRRGRFSWSVLPDGDYDRAYRGEKLNPYSWLRRYRNAGAHTPAAPPGE